MESRGFFSLAATELLRMRIRMIRDAIQNLAPPHGFGLPAITMLRCKREWWG
jgi:hypothetical protein